MRCFTGLPRTLRLVPAAEDEAEVEVAELADENDALEVGRAGETPRGEGARRPERRRVAMCSEH